ncbi:MAG: ABC transporter permease, partial [Caldilineales bacterium]|nr:ABC transporter permease [Caldilineales bacterium]
LVLGIALGVAVIVSIDLANVSAERGFELSTTTITGRATHAIVAGDRGVDETVYVALRTDPSWRRTMAMAPIVRVLTSSPRLEGIPLTLLGVDPFAEAPFRAYLSDGSVPVEAAVRLLTVPGAVFLAAPLAARYGLEPCPPDRLDASCRLTLVAAGREHEAHIVGLLDPADAFSRRGLETLVLTDIATAQRFGDMAGRLSQIDLILPDDVAPDALAATLPPGHLVVPAGRRSGQVVAMTEAFRINLTALSLLALVVGIFLIYNMMTFAVVQRRPLFGTLRSLGYTREQIFGMVLAEAALVALLGTALGLGLGVVLGQATVRLVTRTINDLFFVVNTRDVPMPLASLVKGSAAGILAGLIAAALPAWDAASVPPRLALLRTDLESKAQRLVVVAAGGGLILAVIGAVVLALPTRSLVISFGGTFAVLIGLAALTPWLTFWLMRFLSIPLGRWLGLLGRLATRGIIRAQSRLGIAIAALMAAVAVTIGVQVMIDSFRTTVSLWLDEALRGDIYISVAGFSANRPDEPLPPEVVALVRGYPGAAGTAGLRVVGVESAYGPLELVAVDPDTALNPRLLVQTQGTPAQVAEAFRQGAVILSEPLANHLGIERPGGALDLLTPQGWRSFPIVAIETDYASTRGTVRMSLAVYRRLWNDERLNGLTLFLPEGADIEAVTADLRRRLSAFSQVQVSPNQALREGALAIFDRTFAITVAMRLITILVAFTGVWNALLAFQLDKAREMGILRALGLTLADMHRLALIETGLAGAAAGLLAIPTGYVLAWILIFIINKRSFGWTLQMHLEPAAFVQAFGLAVGAALLAALYPAWRLHRLDVAAALRND